MDHGAANQIVRTWSLGDNYLLFYLGKSYLTTCSNMLSLLSAYRLWRGHSPENNPGVKVFSNESSHLSQNCPISRKHTNTHLLSLSDAVRNGFLPFLDSRFRKNFLKFMIIYGWLFNFSQISEALESLKLSKNPRERRQAGLQGQEDRGTRGGKGEDEGRLGMGRSIPISFSVSSALV